MKSWRVLLGVVGAVLVCEIAFSAALAVIVYQALPKSVLARQTFIGSVPGLLAGARVLDRSLNVFYWGPASPEPLPQYALTVAPEDLRRIEESLPRELPSPWYGNLFLTEDAKEWVPGLFHADGQEYAVEVRVRGDIFNHWAYQKKSWRVRLKDGKVFRGMREFNLIIPEDRGWIAEPLNAFRAKKFGFVQPQMRFVLLSFNGSSPMVYTEVEQWGKEMLEQQGRPGDVNVYGIGGGTSFFQQWDAAFDDVVYWHKYERSAVTPKDSHEEVAALTALAQPGAHADPSYMSRVAALLDPEQLVRWYALSLLAGSRHVRDHNLRFFFDPSRGRFEPLPWDIGLYAPRTLLSLPGNPLLNEVFRVPAYKLAALRFVWEYIHNDAMFAEDRAAAQRLRATVERAAYRDSLKLPSNRTVWQELDRAVALLEQNIAFLKEELSLSEVLLHQRVPSSTDAARGLLLTIDIVTRGIAPAKLFELSVPPSLVQALARGEVQLLRDDGDGRWGTADSRVPLTLRATSDKKERPVFQTTDDLLALAAPGDPIIGPGEEVLGAPHTLQRFFLVRLRGRAALPDDAVPLNLDVRNAVTGKKAQVLGDVLMDGRTFEHLPEAYASRVEFLRRYPFFQAEGASGVLLQGMHTFSEDVIIPSTVHLRIAPGTTLRMGSGVTLLSYAPVAVRGTADAPIRVVAATPYPWGSFLVVRARGQSFVEWAEFSDGGQTFLNDVFASGMVAFHDSPVTVRDATFRNSHGDDALNIKYVPVDIARTQFINPDADAIDLDAPPSGLIEDTTILVEENGGDRNGDGIDLSWAPVTIRRVTIDGSGDKCISVGENSHPLIQDSLLNGCTIGIASKDSSAATAERVRFEGNRIALSAYTKKPIFGPASIVARQSSFEGNAVQSEATSGSTITLE